MNLVFFLQLLIVMFFYSVYKITKVLFVVSTDHLAVQGGLTDVLRQLAVGFSRPQSQSLVAWLRELYRDRLRQLVNPACGRSSTLFPVLFLYACHSIYCLQLVHSLSATVGSKIPPPSWWSEAFWGSQNITSLPPLRTKDETFAFQLSMPKVADLNSHNLRHASKSSS